MARSSAQTHTPQVRLIPRSQISAGAYSIAGSHPRLRPRLCSHAHTPRSKYGGAQQCTDTHVRTSLRLRLPRSHTRISTHNGGSPSRSRSHAHTARSTTKREPKAPLRHLLTTAQHSHQYNRRATPRNAARDGNLEGPALSATVRTSASAWPSGYGVLPASIG